MLSALIIGNELLNGDIVDSNFAFALQRCREHHINVKEARFVSDEVHTIAHHCRELSLNTPFVFTAGGIGPTHDDVTMEALALAFNDQLMEEPNLKEKVKAYFGPRFGPGHHKLFHLPSQMRLHWPEAKGWPLFQIHNCFILPGLPFVFEQKFPQMLKLLPTPAPRFHETLFLNVGEGAFAQELEETQKSFPEVAIGSYPLVGQEPIRVRITLKSTHAQDIKRCHLQLSTWFQSQGWLEHQDEKGTP